MTNLVQHKKTERFILLYALYRKANGNADFTYNLRDLASEEGLGYRSFKSAFDYLAQEEFLRLRTSSDSADYFFHASITEWGIRAVEKVFDNETQPTEYFPPYREMMM